MASSLSKDDREHMERFIAEHEPYPEDAPETNMFDDRVFDVIASGDKAAKAAQEERDNRRLATLYKKMLKQIDETTKP